ncbi:unnamed protein product [Rhizophagus irregularis]|nr:unnamed protein product [Rhizophagus irregularis]
MLIHQIFLSSKAERVKPVQSSASTSVRNPSTNTMQNNVSLKQPTESPPSSGSPDIPLNPSPLQIHDLASLKLLGKKMKNLWTAKHDICSPYDCSKNFLESITLSNLQYDWVLIQSRVIFRIILTGLPNTIENGP